MRHACVLSFLLCAACAPAASTGSTDIAELHQLQPGVLDEVTRTYTVSYQGNPVGEYVYSLAKESRAGRQLIRINRAFATPDGPVEQLALFDARTFEPIRSESRGAITVDLVNAAGTIRGTVGTANAPAREMNEPLPTGALLPYMFEAVLAASPLRVGYARDFLVVNPASAKIETVGMRVLAEETVTVPAGTFEVYRVEITGFEPETAYFRKAMPHIPIKQDLAAPVSIQLSTETR